MNFENLKGLLGEAYHDGITAEEVNNFFKGKTFADLSTGNYVDKNKYDRDINALNTTIAEKNNALNSKLTDDERLEQERNADKAEIERLTKLLNDNKITSNSDLAKSVTANIVTTLGLEENDKDFASFLTNIVSDDREKTNKIATYVSKLVTDAYTKGQKDNTKDALGEFGKGKSGSKAVKKEGESLGAQLGKKSQSTKKTVDYFAKN